MNTEATQYKDQLPKANRINFIEFYKLVASTVALVSVFGGWYFTNNNNVNYVYAVFLCLLVVVLMIYIYIRERSKLTRYAECVFFVHFINHIIRDYFGNLQAGKEQAPEDTLSDIMSAISSCFAILTGKVCSCFLKEIQYPEKEDKAQVKIVSYDPITYSKFNKFVEHQDHEHLLADNTAFNNLWYYKDGCSRYYLCQDLIKRWKTHDYKSSYFNHPDVGQPKVREFLGFFSFVTRWPLAARSCLIVPIRYTRHGKQTNSDASDKTNKITYLWGFLCIYCNSRRVFERRYSPELAGAFADALYVFLNELRLYKSTRGEKHASN